MADNNNTFSGEQQSVPFRRIPRFTLFLLMQPIDGRGAVVCEKRDDTTAWIYGYVGKDKTPPAQGGARLQFKRTDEIRVAPQELVLPYAKA